MDKVTIAVGRLSGLSSGPVLLRRSGLVYYGAHYDEARRVYLPVEDLAPLIKAGYIEPVDLDYGVLCLLVQEGPGLWVEHWYIWLGNTGMAKYYPEAGELARAPETIPQEELTDADLPF